MFCEIVCLCDVLHGVLCQVLRGFVLLVLMLITYSVKLDELAISCIMNVCNEMHNYCSALSLSMIQGVVHVV